MDTAQWAQGNIGVVKPPMEGSNSNSKPPPILERKVRPQKDQALNCPRCNSTNTKFCYYNNYSLSQPRYFCKTCRRYWTEGGTLRNVPVGGGSRKNKRSTPSSSSSTSTKKFPDLSTLPNFPHSSPPSSSAAVAVNSQNPKMIHQGQDLNLAYPPPPPPPSSVEDYSNNNNNNGSITKFIEVPYNSSEEDKRGLNYFIPNISGGFPNLQEFKPGLGFTIHEGFENTGYNGGIQGIHQEGTVGARILFPFEDLKQQVPTSTEFDVQNRSQGDHSTPGYWNGMLGGGSW